MDNLLFAIPLIFMIILLLANTIIRKRFFKSNKKSDTAASTISSSSELSDSEDEIHNKICHCDDDDDKGPYIKSIKNYPIITFFDLLQNPPPSASTASPLEKYIMIMKIVIQEKSLLLQQDL